ncbi:hypothetical protein [Kosakonia sacchari]|uniref:hypothetical protein n=1 Tax=Kosakonia sacchari TaxID=1158459 RepID=UPI00136247AE|nr:hypothetical protein [Kosakonia sacchari]QHM95642.1 hypothetical protein FGE25_15805 [Kosakonia sacchari]
MINKIDANEITKEKNLWDVYLLCRRISISPFHICIMLTASIFLITNAFFLEKNLPHLISDIRNWSSIGFNFTVTTLGFLIAGFTIFATLSKPDMFLTMMATKHKKTQMPTLKYNFMVFMKVFISFIVFTFLYLIIILFCQTNGIIGNIIALLPNAEKIKPCIIKIGYCVIGTSLIYLLLVVKTFIFNIYAIIMSSIRWELYIKRKQLRATRVNEKKSEQIH